MVFVATLAVYVGTTAALQGLASPEKAYFDQLAAAWLDGDLHLENPRNTADLTQHEGRWYVPFPPLTAGLMLPFVAALGTGHFSTPLFSCVCGALSVALVFALVEMLARRGQLPTTRAEHCWLAAMFGVGSVFWYVSVDGQVWFLAQVTAVLALATAAVLALKTGNPWLAGGALALAMWSRPHLILAWPMLLALVWPRLTGGDAADDADGPQRGDERLQADGDVNAPEGAATVAKPASFAHLCAHLPRIARWSAASLVLPVLAGVGLLGYNAARFGDPLDFGYQTQNVVRELQADLLMHGQFSLHFVPRNAEIMLLKPPRLDARTGWPVPDDRGLSLLITTPVLVLLLWPRPRTPLVVGSAVALGLILVPLLTYYNTGWAQFGYRFSLDFMVPVTLLLAAGLTPARTRPARVLIALGVFVNLWGVLWWLGVYP